LPIIINEEGFAEIKEVEGEEVEIIEE